MKENTNLGVVIDGMDSSKSKYDKNVKQFMSDIQVLARIVKYTVEEVGHLDFIPKRNRIF